MSRLIDALRTKYKTPQAAVQALGLDAALLDDDKEQQMSTLSMLRQKAARLAQDANEFMKELEEKKEDKEDKEEDKKEAKDNDSAFDEDWEDMEKDREAKDKRAADARTRLGRDETEEERDEREKEESAQDARKRLGRDETEEERAEREDCEGEDRKARDGYRRARDARLRADDAMRSARDGYRKVMDRKRGMDARRGLGRDETEEEKEEREEKDAEDRHARDNPPSFKGMPKPGGDKAMDEATVRRTVEAAIAADRERQSELRDAEHFVRAWLGNTAPMALDATAEDVYRTAFKALNKDVTGVHPSAFRTILSLIPKPGANRGREQQVAMDAAGSKGFAEMFPAASRVTLQ